MSIPVIGKSDQPNNPLLLLANVMERVIEPLREIAANTRPDASAVLPHRYAVTVVQDSTPRQNGAGVSASPSAETTSSA